MKRVLIVIAAIAAIACSKSEKKTYCWSCNLQDPLSGRVDHKDTCTNLSNYPIVLYVDGVPYSAVCVEQ